MNSNWRNRPTTIDYISKSADYIISIDESGSANLRQVQKAKRNGTEAADSENDFVAEQRLWESTCERNANYLHGQKAVQLSM